ncbi:hypothetical protein [Nocardia sp. NPDC020380]|uniref:hypothetical protein n=1 Tax=Nocardia sp. NPDC020380 TaxID=3364309 RepID=UPI0037A486AB
MADPTMSDLYGLASGEQLKFDPKAAANAMNACNDLIGKLLAVGKQMDQTAGNTKDFSGPHEPFASGRKWADGFRQLLNQAHSILNQNVQTLTNFENLFKEAAKSFANAEDDSTTAFQKIKVATEASTDGLAPRLNDQQIGDKIKKPNFDYDTIRRFEPGDHQAASTSYKAPTDDRSVSPENSMSLHWGDFWNLKQNIDLNVKDLGTDWHWMQDQMNQSLDNFQRDVCDNSLFNNGWTGVSAGSAAKAASDYVTEARKFATKLGAVGDKLYTVAGYLTATENAMPTSADHPAILAGQGYTTKDGKSVPGSGYYSQDGDRFAMGNTEDECLEEMLRYYRTAFDQLYVNGIEDYNGSLVNFDPFPFANFDLTPKQPDDPSKKSPSDVPSQDGPSPSSPGSPKMTAGIPDSPQDPSNQDPSKDNPTKDDPTKDDPTKTDPTKTTTNDPTSQLTSLAQSLAQQGASVVQTLAQQGAQLLTQGIQSIEQSVQQTKQTTPDDTQTKQVQDILQNLQSQIPNSPGGQPTLPTGGTPSGTPITPVRDNPQTRLFPRASAPDSTQGTSDTAIESRAGLASTSTSSGTSSTPMGGSPMGAAGGQQGSGKEHKRPEYLKAGTHLDEVFQSAPEAVTPVAEK